MKKYIISFLIPFTIFISFNGYGQEIDSSIIQNLTSDQIAIAKDAINSSNLKASKIAGRSLSALTPNEPVQNVIPLDNGGTLSKIY